MAGPAHPGGKVSKLPQAAGFTRTVVSLSSPLVQDVDFASPLLPWRGGEVPCEGLLQVPEYFEPALSSELYEGE